MSLIPGGNTWAEDNPLIEQRVLFAIKHLAVVQDEMMSTNAEGQSVLEGLLEAQTAIGRAIDLYAEDTPRSEPAEQDISLLPHIILTGNPVEGFELYGPFDNFIAAVNHMDTDGNMPDDDWWLAPLHSVDDTGEAGA